MLELNLFLVYKNPKMMTCILPINFMDDINNREMTFHKSSTLQIFKKNQILALGDSLYKIIRNGVLGI